MNSDKYWVVGSIAGIIIIFIILMIILWVFGFFNFTGTDASAKINSSALVLVGSVIATVGSIIGIFLRQSIEKRNIDLKEQAEMRLIIEAERTNNLKKEAENRLKQEVAIQAIGLLDPDSGGVDTKKAGVLFTLTNLGNIGLAITMLRKMLENNNIDMNTGVWIINRALKSDDKDSQGEACEILRDFSSKLLRKGGGNYWPTYLTLRINPKLPTNARRNIVLAVSNMIEARPYNEWDKLVLHAHVVLLWDVWKNDLSEDIRSGAGFCLKEIIRILPAGLAYYNYSHTDILYIDSLKKYLENYCKAKGSPSLNYTNSVLKLKKWASDYLNSIPT